MDAAEAVIARTLESLRWELDQKLRAEQAYQEIEDAARKRDGIVPKVASGILEPPDPHTQRLLDISELVIQVKLLEHLQTTLDEQRREKYEPVVAVSDRDGRSSKQNLWPTVTTSVISLIIGWFLSLVGSPATVLHLFGH